MKCGQVCDSFILFNKNNYVILEVAKTIFSCDKEYSLYEMLQIYVFFNLRLTRIDEARCFIQSFYWTIYRDTYMYDVNQ